MNNSPEGLSIKCVEVIKMLRPDGQHGVGYLAMC